MLEKKYKSMGIIVLCDCGTWVEMKYYTEATMDSVNDYRGGHCIYESDPEGTCTSCGTEFLMLYDRILDFPKD